MVKYSYICSILKKPLIVKKMYNMKTSMYLTGIASLFLIVNACKPSGNCVVKGTVQGVRNGVRVELTNAWDNFKVVGTGVVRDGAFEIHPRFSGPAHVYLYTHGSKGIQLKDFILEPGTILVEATAEDESLLSTGAVGTPYNDLLNRYRGLLHSGQTGAAMAIRDSVMAEDPAGPIALYFSANHESAAKALATLDRLAPELASMPFVASLKEELTRRARTEPRVSDSEPAHLFVDMEFPDADGNPVRLSEVVGKEDNRYVILDFWATWCSPCREALPKLREVYAKYHGMGVEIYSVSEDINEKNWKQFILDNGMDWINVRDTKPGRGSGTMWETYALSGIPTVLLIDGETGEILARDNHLDLDAILSGLLPS